MQANVTPIRDGDQIIGYMSVRIKPDPADVQTAEALYARMREQAASGRLTLKFSRGKLLVNSLVGRLKRWLIPSQTGRLKLLLVSVVSVPAVAVAVLGPWAGLAVPVFAVLAVWGVWRMAFGPLQSVLADAYQLAAGNLAHNITNSGAGIAGELRQALKQLSLNLRTVISDSRTEIENVRTASHEIAAASQDMSARTESQASSLEETAASMEQINTTVRNSADAAQHGAQEAARTAQATNEANEAVLALAETMTSINESSRRMSDIIKIVEDVAFQTNILALNAAVEVARAGEAGRGFAVVAGEVRQLAQRASSAVKEIKSLIDTASERINDGGVRAEQAREHMSGVLSQVNHVSQTLDGIRRAAQEQQQGIAQINGAISQLDAITQQNAAMVEQLLAAAQSLSGRVDAVQSSLRLFRLRACESTLSAEDAVALRRAVKQRVPTAAAAAHAPIQTRKSAWSLPRLEPA